MFNNIVDHLPARLCGQIACAHLPARLCGQIACAHLPAHLCGQIIHGSLEPFACAPVRANCSTISWAICLRTCAVKLFLRGRETSEILPACPCGKIAADGWLIAGGSQTGFPRSWSTRSVGTGLCLRPDGWLREAHTVVCVGHWPRAPVKIYQDSRHSNDNMTSFILSAHAEPQPSKWETVTVGTADRWRCALPTLLVDQECGNGPMLAVWRTVGTSLTLWERPTAGGVLFPRSNSASRPLAVCSSHALGRPGVWERLTAGGVLFPRYNHLAQPSALSKPSKY